MNNDFKIIFKKLKSILFPYADKMTLVVDNQSEFFLNTNFIMKNKKPLYFCSVKINKNYVSYHLMPVYVSPNLLDPISNDLKKRMQGKSCFNFKKIDQDLFNELSLLTKEGYKFYQQEGYLLD